MRFSELRLITACLWSTSCYTATIRIRSANADWKAESTAEPRQRGHQWKSPGSCRNFEHSNLLEKDGEHAKQQFIISFGATFSAVKGRKRLTSFGNFVRRHKGFASLRSRLSREWSSICRKSMNGFAATARITNFAGSQPLTATSSAWRSTKCFIATTYRRSSRLMKRLNWQKLLAVANQAVSSTVSLIV